MEFSVSTHDCSVGSSASLRSLQDKLEDLGLSVEGWVLSCLNGLRVQGEGLKVLYSLLHMACVTGVMRNS